MKIVKQEVELLKFNGSDLDVANAARVSFHKHSKSLTEKDIKLINYLAKHNHFTPFCHNSLTFRIKAPIFVSRQMHKHVVGGIINEVSRRYVDEEPEFYFPTSWRKRAENVKQGSSEETLDKIWWIPEDSFYSIEQGVKEITQYSLRRYLRMIKEGVAPEQARMILPQNTMTEWWWTGSLMFFARVCKQRLEPNAQYESREVASLIAASIPSEFTHSWKALMGQGN